MNIFNNIKENEVLNFKEELKELKIKYSFFKINEENDKYIKKLIKKNIIFKKEIIPPSFILKRDLVLKENSIYNTSFDENNILFTSSFLSLPLSLSSFIQENDEVISFSPLNNEIDDAVSFFKAKNVIIDTTFDLFQLNEEKIIDAINKDTKALIIESPALVNGVALSLKSLKILNDILELYSSIYLIFINKKEDELFFFKNTGIEKFKNILERTIIIKSFSYFKEEKIDYIIASNKIISKLQEKNKRLIYIPEYIFKAILNMHKIKNKKLKKKCYFAYNYIKKCGLNPSLNDGGSLMMINIITENQNSKEFALDLALKKGVGVLPSSLFKIEGYIILDVDVKKKILKKGIKQIVNYIDKKWDYAK